jgi:hypothetical protein
MPPEPTAETAVTRNYVASDGKTYPVKMSGLFARPDLAPDPAVPNNTFSSLPTALSYVAQRAVNEDARIRELPDNMRSPSQKTFIDSPPPSRVFQMFPRVIGQAFMEGQLGPEDVVKQMSGLNDFARNVGATDETSYQRFGEFLNNSMTVIGATRFGFQLGSFLDKAFNIPKIPVHSEFLEFILAGKPISNLPPIDTTRNISLVNSWDYLPPPPAPNKLDLRYVPPPVVTPPPSGQSAASAKSQSFTEKGQAVGIAGVAASPLSGAGMPVVAAIFAIVAAGFTIANMFQSGRQRIKAKKQEEEYRKQQAEAMRQAQLEAVASQSEAQARQLAQERFAGLQKQARTSESDFQRRLQYVLKEGMTYASLAQQPKEFVNRLIDKYEPQLLEFQRKPNYQSRLNLISQIEGSIPKARS